MTVSLCHAISQSSTLRINQLPLGVVSVIPRSKMSQDAIAAPVLERVVQVSERGAATTSSPQPVRQDRGANKREDILDAKPLIGRKYDDNEVQRDREHLPFRLINKSEKPTIQVKHRGDLCDLVRAAPPCSFPTLPSLHDADT